MRGTGRIHRWGGQYWQEMIPLDNYPLDWEKEMQEVISGLCRCGHSRTAHMSGNGSCSDCPPTQNASCLSYVAIRANRPHLPVRGPGSDRCLICQISSALHPTSVEVLLNPTEDWPITEPTFSEGVMCRCGHMQERHASAGEGACSDCSTLQVDCLGFVPAQSDQPHLPARREPTAEWCTVCSHSIEDHPTREVVLRETFPIISQHKVKLLVTDSKVLDNIRSALDVQGAQGNWDFDPYMHGMYNGMELIAALLVEREPQFRAAPDRWLYQLDDDAVPEQVSAYLSKARSLRELPGDRDKQPSDDGMGGQ